MKEFADGMTIEEWMDYWRDNPVANEQRKADGLHLDGPYTRGVLEDLQAAGEEIKRLRKEATRAAALIRDIREVLMQAPELNPANWTEEDALALNATVDKVCCMIDSFNEGKEGEVP